MSSSVPPQRSDAALAEPPDLTGFPDVHVPSSRKLYRSVAYQRPKPRGAWFFASGGGRFDLAEPMGTCYLATDLQTAIRERVASTISQADMVPETVMYSMEVVELNLPNAATLADTGHELAANFGSIRELGASHGDYERTCRWASAFHSAGFGGILYESRFTSVSEATAIALFDKARAKDWREGDRISGEEAFVRAKMFGLVKRVPSSKTAPIATPPKPLPKKKKKAK